MFELSMPRALPEEFGACYLSPAEVFVVGGHDSVTHAVLTHTYIINTVTKRVTEKAPLPTALKALRLVYVSG
jgi:hypothetical protein